MSEVYSIIPRKKRGFFNLFSLTIQLIFLNLICFILFFTAVLIYGEDFIANNLALTPSLILSGGYFWTLATSMFIHAGFFHLFVNMFSLFFVGSFLENLIGKKRFLWIYLASGIIGGLFFVFSALLFGDLTNPAVGASGAIFGLLGVLAILVPYSKIYLIAGPFLLMILEVILPPGFSYFIDILILIMIFSLFSFNPAFRKISIPIELPMWLLPIVAIVPLVIIGIYVDLPIANSGHLGGLVAGLVYGIYLRMKFPNKTKKIQKYFS